MANECVPYSVVELYTFVIISECRLLTFGRSRDIICQTAKLPTAKVCNDGRKDKHTSAETAESNAFAMVAVANSRPVATMKKLATSRVVQWQVLTKTVSHGCSVLEKNLLTHFL